MPLFQNHIKAGRSQQYTLLVLVEMNIQTSEDLSCSTVYPKRVCLGLALLLLYIKPVSSSSENKLVSYISFKIIEKIENSVFSLSASN